MYEHCSRWSRRLPSAIRESCLGLHLKRRKARTSRLLTRALVADEQLHDCSHLTVIEP
jgi:hypothetical protein